MQSWPIVSLIMAVWQFSGHTWSLSCRLKLFIPLWASHLWLGRSRIFAMKSVEISRLDVEKKILCSVENSNFWCFTFSWGAEKILILPPHQAKRWADKHHALPQCSYTYITASPSVHHYPLSWTIWQVKSIHTMFLWPIVGIVLYSNNSASTTKKGMCY